MAQNDKNVCLSHSISQEAYIIWLWFLIPICKMMTSPDDKISKKVSKKGQKMTHNYQFQSVALNISGIVDHVLKMFLLCVRQTFMSQLILPISLWEFIFFWSERNLVLICMFLQFMWRKDFLLHRTYL